MAEQVSIMRRLIGYALLVLLIVAFAWLGARLLDFRLPVSTLASLAGVASLAIVGLNVLKFVGVVLDETRIKLITAIVALLAALIPTVNTVVKLRDTTQRPSISAAVAGQAIDPRGQWIGHYTWHNFETGADEEWAETIIIDAYDGQTGRFEGKAIDDDGQDTRITGQEFGNALVFYYVSNKSIRPSFGSATLEFDNRNGTTLQGLLILREVRQQRLMSGSYKWERKTFAPTT